jgi:hypothetical protein
MAANPYDTKGAGNHRQPGQITISFGQFGAKLAVILIGLGLLAIAGGWNGAASQTSLLFAFPYLLSGGLLGLSLVITGAALMVAQSAREDRARLEAKFDALLDAVHGAGGVAGGAPAGVATGPRTAAGAPIDVSGLVVAGSASYHAPGCRLVDGREDVNYLTPAEAQSRDLKACRVCQPETATTPVSVQQR